MKNFSSLKFMRLFLTDVLPPSVTFIALYQTDAYLEIEDCIDTIMAYYNARGGFNVLGWCKKGEITDFSNEEGEVVASDTINYRVVQITPNNEDEAAVRELKYDVANI